MRVILFIGSLLVLLSPAAHACDACGCANSGSYFGLMPQSNKTLVGVRYQQLHFKSHPDSRVLVTDEAFHVGELYTRFSPINRVQVMAFLPYRFSSQTTTSETKTQNGLGDASVLINYNLLKPTMDPERMSAFTHTLLVGGGLKLPTGRFKYEEGNTADVANPNFQLGTGSTDFMINAFYTLNYKSWGLAANLTRKFNTTNKDHYRFGNQLYGTIDLFKSFDLSTIKITPSVGVYAEKSALGKRDGIAINETGGTLVNGTMGITLFANRWTLGVTAQKPLAQNLSDGFVLAKPRGMIQLGWMF
ncbi:hypothetical protein CLV98_106134 [Dyadobacter jejuensis]|uniref:Outer membrane beta-barrel porin/alpha-amylase n=1 Tax=Dyadobacter jejuensis TaxID=1082580 RepID=A0A316AJA8_9BACT|nr:hypothetical protein [Dyadobacter jejuensis]PWJ57662.1 hypothetical protein CLV98_106134 [Dyadobacter jejuensis]